MTMAKKAKREQVKRDDVKRDDVKREPVQPVEPVVVTEAVQWVESLDDPTAAPTIDSVIRALPQTPGKRFSSRHGEVKLTGEQGRLQSRIFDALRDQGLRLRRPSDVYGWLLDQVEIALSQRT
jgi:hypothetical protein